MENRQFNIHITLEGALSAPHTVVIQAQTEDEALKKFYANEQPFVKTAKDDYVNLNKMLWFSIKEVK